VKKKNSNRIELKSATSSNMSVPSPYTQGQRTSPNDVQCKVVSTNNDQAHKGENCRDYLRTGRCKYGPSCKYNHPANVQSGGGMKAPIDSSEPLFPVRYNEPVCQYYMKHGTCKFGQACKFNHPPQVAGTSNTMNGNGNTTVLVSIPLSSRKEDGAHTMWNTGGNGNDSNVQLLPQRLDEPNCIYFLKNGRCKYGASCRYHHPLNYQGQHDRIGGFEDNRNRQYHHQDHRSAHKVHYVTALPPGSMQQGHFVVENGTVTFLSLDGNTPAHVVSIPQNTCSTGVGGGGGKEGASFYNTTTPATTVASSSTSSTSIASSFETPFSNVDTHESSGGSLWNRKAASGIEGSAYNLPRVVSTGSSQIESNNTLYYNDANNGNRPSSTWRGTRSSSFDHTRLRSSSLGNTQDEDIRRSTSVQSALDQRAIATTRPRSLSTTDQGTRSQRLPGEVDDGLSMMTSALLTMLDTPEEAATAANQVYHQGYEFDEQQNIRSYEYTKPVSSRTTATLEDSREYHNHNTTTYYGQQTFLGQGMGLGLGQNTTVDEDHTSDPGPLGFLSSQQEGQDKGNQINRIQSWQGSAVAGVIHENSQFSSINPTHQTSSYPNTSTDVGLYY
ncbi:MAG: hypothetical protein ACI8RD_011913, partial [Bacillariaceae sp.]|jgi:hypothetical protein